MTETKLQEMLETLENGNISDFKAWLSGLHPFEAAMVGYQCSLKATGLITIWAGDVELEKRLEKSR